MGTQRLATRLGIDSRGEHSQDTSKQIRVAIKELFPLIPDADIESIIDHAFREVFLVFSLLIVVTNVV